MGPEIFGPNSGWGRDFAFLPKQKPRVGGWLLFALETGISGIEPMLYVDCRCGKRISARNDLAGKRIRCKQCGTVLRLGSIGERPRPSTDHNLANAEEMIVSSFVKKLYVLIDEPGYIPKLMGLIKRAAGVIFLPVGEKKLLTQIVCSLSLGTAVRRLRMRFGAGSQSIVDKIYERVFNAYYSASRSEDVAQSVVDLIDDYSRILEPDRLAGHSPGVGVANLVLGPFQTDLKKIQPDERLDMYFMALMVDFARNANGILAIIEESHGDLGGEVSPGG